VAQWAGHTRHICRRCQHLNAPALPARPAKLETEANSTPRKQFLPPTISPGQSRPAPRHRPTQERSGQTDWLPVPIRLAAPTATFVFARYYPYVASIRLYAPCAGLPYPNSLDSCINQGPRSTIFAGELAREKRGIYRTIYLPALDGLTFRPLIASARSQRG
jgi:hypothetical protein